MESSKTCTKCDREQPVTEFYLHPQMKDGRLNKCRECCKKDNQRTRRMREHGVTPEQFEALEPEKGCRGCGGKATDIDHCHASGKIRGLLCRSCNLTLGLVKDRPETLRALADYLEN